MELSGVSIASLGVAFQMFNAAFLSAPVETRDELRERLGTAQAHFEKRGLAWAFWVCEDWLARGVRRGLSAQCASVGLTLAAELPGMAAGQVGLPGRRPKLAFRRVETEDTLQDFRGICSNCFHVPMGWFSEVFDEDLGLRPEFICWVGYADDVPVTTAASVCSGEGVLGLYNIATAPGHRRRGYAEAITRHAIDEASKVKTPESIVLQSTSMGMPLYSRLGFKPVTRILVYNSGR